MAPISLVESSPSIDLANLKAKVVNHQVEVETIPRPPVADNFMYDFKYNHELPTTNFLGREIPAELDAQAAAEDIADRLAECLGTGDAAAFTDLFADYGEPSSCLDFAMTDWTGVWRDKLSFTWDYRTFNFRDNIARAAADLVPSTPVRNVAFLKPPPQVKRPYPDLAYLQFVLSFDTDLANAHAVVNAVLTKEGWRIWTLHTVIEGLHQYPERDPVDGHMTGPISWEKQRALDDDQIKPDVVIVGGGQK